MKEKLPVALSLDVEEIETAANLGVRTARRRTRCVPVLSRDQG